jgi:1-acyl-sn-glycerol-3-phosphate acyltransferase
MLRPVYFLLFKILGWRINGSIPADLKKYIFAVGPHTSNWDFLMGLIARSVLHLRNARFLGKSSLFRFPYGWIFRLMGGYPVDRSKNQDMTTQVAEIFNSHEYFILGIAPEGTRKKVEKLRTGFYYIAKKAGIPILPCGFDYGRKELVIGKPLWPGKDIEKDMAKLMKFYQSIKGKNPELGPG